MTGAPGLQVMAAISNRFGDSVQHSMAFYSMTPTKVFYHIPTPIARNRCPNRLPGVMPSGLRMVFAQSMG